MRNILIIGGTGMLRQATEWLLKNTENVVIVGRNKPKFLDKSDKNSYFYFLDYRFIDDVEIAMDNIKKTFGEFDLILAWIHSPAKDSFNLILNKMKNNKKYRLFHVKSYRNEVWSDITVPDNCLYRSIELGYCEVKNHTRWLTHDEISHGVVEAIKEDSVKKSIGKTF